MKNLRWGVGWVFVIAGIVLGCVSLGLLAGVMAVLGFIAVVFFIAGVLLIDVDEVEIEVEN